MDAHWVNHRAGYQCGHGRTSAQTRTPDQPRSIYVREDRLLETLADRLDLTNHAEIGPYMKTQQLAIVCSAEGAEIQLRGRARTDRWPRPYPPMG
jgi:hypothetical protein